MKLRLAAVCLLVAGCSSAPPPTPEPRDGARTFFSAPPEPAASKYAFMDFDRAVEKCRALDPLREELRRTCADLSRREQDLPAMDSKPLPSAPELRARKKALERELAVKRIEVFRRVRDIVADLAKRRGLDGVFKWDPVRLDGGDPEIDGYEISVCRVLYRSDSVDLTGEVIRALNGR